MPLITLLIIQNKESNHLTTIFGILKKSGKKLTSCATQTFNQLMQQGIDLKDIVGISVTTFGVDGAPLMKMINSFIRLFHGSVHEPYQ